MLTAYKFKKNVIAKPPFQRFLAENLDKIRAEKVSMKVVNSMFLKCFAIICFLLYVTMKKEYVLQNLGATTMTLTMQMVI